MLNSTDFAYPYFGISECGLEAVATQAAEMSYIAMRRRIRMMDLILVVDLEATCADDGSILPGQMEIIEVGAVWATQGGEAIAQFQRFVQPFQRPQLTPFCMSLTHIDQASIDTASGWPTVAGELMEFAQQHEGLHWGSWGNYDSRQIARECAACGIASPLSRLSHRNLKAEFAKRRRIKQVGMATALRIAGLDLLGDHHRALSDAINIARLLPLT